MKGAIPLSGVEKTIGGYLREDEHLLLSLKEVIHPAHTALLVVDMQNDFVHGRGRTAALSGTPPNNHEAMVPRLVRFVEVCRKVGVPVFWILTHHGRDLDLPAYKARMVRLGQGPKNLEGSEGAELIRELVPQKGERFFIKHGYDGFTGTDLDLCLRNRGMRTLIMSGNDTNVCVDTTLKHGFHLGYYIVIGSDLTSTLIEGAQEMYIKNFAGIYGLVAAAQEMEKTWGVE